MPDERSPELIKEHRNQEDRMKRSIYNLVTSLQFEFDDLDSGGAWRLADAIVKMRGEFKEALK